MTLDHDICYRAVSSRDARFDGHFFTGVKTTGVYCRPVCPARTPKQVNLRFFQCAAAAEQAGFRPCLRCRPETSPGSPAWLGSNTTVSRALRLIHDGALDFGSVDELADRLGLGARQLRRLFVEHLGATPIAIAQTQRAHFAKRLITETNLSMTAIAHCAGFSSVRRFNATVKRVFDRTPSQMRHTGKRRPHTVSGTTAEPVGLSLRLPYRQPFDWSGLARFLAARAIPGVEIVASGSYLRTFEAGGVVGILEVKPVPDSPWLQLTVDTPPTRELMRISEKIRRQFDLRADPQTIGRHLGEDALLRPFLEACPGVRVPGAFDSFEIAVRAILGQQVTVKAATTISGRLASRCGTSLASPRDGLTHVFPSAEVLAKADLARLGIPQARADTITALARAVHADGLDLDAAPDLDQYIQRLTAIRGIGPWTAKYIAMRVLGEPDAFPETDLGLREAFKRQGQSTVARDMLARAERWRPWRAYAARILWSSLEIQTQETERDR